MRYKIQSKSSLPYVTGSLSVIDFHLSYLKVIDMVKDEMVKQGKGRGTGRPGKIVLNNPLFVLGVIVSSNLLSSQNGSLFCLSKVFTYRDEFKQERVNICPN